MDDRHWLSRQKELDDNWISMEDKLGSLLRQDFDDDWTPMVVRQMDNRMDHKLRS